MALLSATQGTPERVWSLLNILSAHGGEMDKQALIEWLNPRFTQGSNPPKDERSAVDQTIQAAVGLKLIDMGQRRSVRCLVDPIPTHYMAFSDLVHSRLTMTADEDADSVLLEAYAWLVIQIEIEGSTVWIQDWTADKFADTADAAILPREGDPDRRFNKTKRAPWQRWMEMIGLSITLPTGNTHPDLTTRLERELFNGALPIDTELPVDQLMSHLAKYMPYLNGGRLFERVRQRLQFSAPTRTVSRLLSASLRDLQEDDRISLVARGDAADNFMLAHDNFSRWRSFGSIILRSTADQEATRVNP
jgi:hypothetical protein